MLVTLGGFAAVALQAVYPLLSSVLLATSDYFWRQHRAPLMPITPRETAVAKRSAWVALIACIVPNFFS